MRHHQAVPGAIPVNVKWRKSSRSAVGDDKVCVEVGRLPRGVGVRDSKAPESGYLSLTAGQFTRLIGQIKHGR
ncbi:DUF397 domain-containing protein [Actinomadura sp. 9N407]|uniref:DUF397 domain-containing protein n=1 Tax=Actinomadura sp. 9N407 TaxID=3375154 RepID=UPI00379CA04F